MFRIVKIYSKIITKFKILRKMYFFAAQGRYKRLSQHNPASLKPTLADNFVVVMAVNRRKA